MATEATGGGLEFHPMDQFVVSPLFGDGPVAWYTPTNVTLWLALTALASIALLVLGTRGRAIVPNRAQSIAEMAYGLVHKMIEDIAGKDGLRYFPYILTLFMFVVFANLLGLLPLAFTTTLAHRRHRRSGAGGVLRRHHHRLRQERRAFPGPVLGALGAAGRAPGPGRDRGHQLLRASAVAVHSSCGQHDRRPRRHQGFAGFAAIAAVAPVAIIAVIGMYAFEVLVAIVQAYVFTILTCVYLKDALHPSH